MVLDVNTSNREGDIHGLYCLTSELNTHFLVRMCVNCLAEIPNMEEEMKNVFFDHQRHHKILLQKYYEVMC